MTQALNLAIVGHTNTGKTSLMRTLLRDTHFGEVKNEAGTTRHVEQATIRLNHTNLVHLFDTPGLEDATGLLEWLEQNTPARADGIERLETFLQSELAQNDFSQEAKVIRQVRRSDMSIYVIDAREPVLNKYRDELTLLSWCARPLMPVFNFIGGQDLKEWSEMLARRGLHVHVGFDTVAFDFEGEMRLWDNLSTMLPNRTLTDELIRIRRDEWQQLDRDARRDIADTLIDVAAYQSEIAEDADPAPALAQMHSTVKQLERQLHEQLLQRYRFYDSDVAPTEINLQEFQQDPFDTEVLKQYGIRTTSGAAAGALVGLGFDAATAGTSLGVGAAIGGLIGGILSNAATISDKLQGIQTIHVDPATITLLATRGLDLLDAIQHRGHAAQNNTITVTERQPPFKPHQLPAPLKKARTKSHWSSSNGKSVEQARAARAEAAEELAKELKR